MKKSAVVGLMMLPGCSTPSNPTPQVQMGEPGDVMAVMTTESEAAPSTPLEASGPEAGCGSPVMTYQCEGVPPDAAACLVSAADGGKAYYPLGCVAEVPGCTAPTVPATPLECTCMANVAPAAFGDAQAVFICPD